MERSEILEMMGTLQLVGMRVAYDEIVSVGIKRQHGAEKIIGALLKAEIAAKNQMTIAKLPLAKHGVEPICRVTEIAPSNNHEHVAGDGAAARQAQHYAQHRDQKGIRRELPSLRHAQGLASVASRGARRRLLHGGASDVERGSPRVIRAGRVRTTPCPLDHVKPKRRFYGALQ